MDFENNNYCLITDQAIACSEWQARVETPEAGAVVFFLGVTRNNNKNRKVKYLYYEAFEKMALKKMYQICSEMQEQHDITKIAMVHRVGKVILMETSVLIAVSAAHRKSAFEAAHHAIDRLKEIVPIWKQEFMESGEVEWIANAESIGVPVSHQEE